ncbi:PadR family transcriptional regulator [Cohnella sp. REN36]|uniref:PadR family transcriptional regulator n=1 Tax=Cohnella sp. REN36 TaxID=2887347 RepID=UPI001D15114B|nr:PadR family transcriptional regulator [Cohnella sp. REN36]MCC3374896.1 PadR family transcriptional regulator [Cohnella sp. REN36]
MQAKYVALALLRSQPRSGYEIKKEFEGNIAYFFEGSYGSVYPALAKLEKEGLIAKRTIVQEDRPNKHEFAITEAGTAALEEYLKSPLLPDSIRSDLCMRLYFAGETEAEDMAGWLANGAEDHRASLAALRSIREEHDAKLPLSMKLSLLIGIRYHESHLNAIEEGLRLLDQTLKGEASPKEE